MHIIVKNCILILINDTAHDSTKLSGWILQYVAFKIEAKL